MSHHLGVRLHLRIGLGKGFHLLYKSALYDVSIKRFNLTPIDTSDGCHITYHIRTLQGERFGQVSSKSARAVSRNR